MLADVRMPDQPTQDGGAGARSALIRRITLITVLANLCFYGLAGFALYQSWVRDEERARLLTQNLAHVFALQIGEAIDKIDLTVFTTADEVEQQLSRGGINAVALNAFIARYRVRVPALDGLRVVNAQGENAYGTDVNQARLTSVADRDYFQRLRSDPQAGVIISAPVLGRVSHKWSIIFARRINQPDGSFAGLAYGTITLEYLQKVFATVDVGQLGALTLRDENLALIARYPMPIQYETEVGKKNASPELQAVIEAHPNGGTYSSDQAFDKVRRIYTYCKIPGRPFYVSAGLAPEEYLAAWRSEAIWVLALAGLFTLGTLVSAGAVCRSWLRNERALQALTREQAALRQSEARLNFALQTIQAGAWELDLLNHTAQRTLLHDQIFGYAQLLPEWTYANFLDHVLPEDREEVDRRFRVATTRHTDWNFECRIRRADGAIRWIFGTGGHELNSAGQPVRITGLVQDITDRKESEAALHESETRFRVLFERAADCILQVEITSDGIPVIRDANSVTFHTLGYDRAELIGQPVAFIDADPEAQKLVGQRRKTLLAGQGRIFECRHRCKDGTIRDFECSITEMQIGSKTIGISVERDITVLKRTHAELKLQGAALAAAASAIVITDSHGTMVWANPAFTILTGYSVAEARGQNPRVLKSGSHASEFYEQMWSTIRAGKVWSGEIVNKRKDGRLYPEEMTITPVHNPQGEITNFIAIKQDITARRLAERQIQESNRQLSVALAELRQTQLQIIQEEKLRGLGQMASGIAHDFNNALSPIVGFSELLLKHPEKLADREQVLKWLTNINTCASDAARVVRRIREFGRQHLGSEGILPIDLTQLVFQTIELTASRWRDQAQASGRTIQMATDLQPVPLIIGEEFAIRELLINLIFNAVDALTGNGTITLGLAVEDRWVRLWVADTGAGMTEEMQKHCFEPFYTTKAQTGSGLGLAMVHSIVQRHGGTVTVASQLGQGTTITVRLPTHDDVPDKVAPAAAVPALARSLHVLVVDDKVLLRDIVAECLTTDHHTVTTAVSAQEGLAQLKAAGPFDLVITDLAMPEMNGEQLAAAIDQTRPGLPVILMTGFGDLMKADGQIPPHVSAILSKPITQGALRAVLAKVFLPS